MNVGTSLRISAVLRPQRPDKSPGDVFKSLDAQNKGYITESEFASSTSTISAGPSGAQGGPRPLPPPRGGEGASSANSKKSSYDPADTNQDGTVSAAENMAAQVKSKSLEANGNSFAARTAVRQYESTAAMAAN
jgi:hypothetical protein